MGDVQPDLPTGSPLTFGLALERHALRPIRSSRRPASGSMHAMNAPMFIKGTASDAGGQVAGVEVSTDNGVTLESRDRHDHWLYRWMPDGRRSRTRSRAARSMTAATSKPPAPGISGERDLAGSGARWTRARRHERVESVQQLLHRDPARRRLSTSSAPPTSARCPPACWATSTSSSSARWRSRPAQVTMFSDWVTQGGNLIAMRPDKQLYGLLGLTDAAGDAVGRLLCWSTRRRAPGAGHRQSDDPVPRHRRSRDAQRRARASPRCIRMPTTATANPAVTLRAVGGNGGQAVAFLYDLARSVVLTRQGNPAWAGQNRDLIDPVRSDDMFFGELLPAIRSPTGST